LLATAFGTKYNLVANVVHDTPPSSEKGSSTADPLLTGSYRAHVLHEGTGQWYEIQDLHVQETQAQFIGVSESYIAIYKRQQFSDASISVRPTSSG
jgi:U4/U6.U5 tri-snRNP-associated protein 2